MLRTTANALDDIAEASESLAPVASVEQAHKANGEAIALQYNTMLFNKTDQKVKLVKLLTGKAACEFLGIEYRHYSQVKAGKRMDLFRINKRFEGLFKEWELDPEEQGLRTPSSGFWKNILIRPWKKEHIEGFNNDGETLTGCLLKARTINGEVIQARYEPPVLDGNQLPVFAPNLSPLKSNHADNTFVQLVSVHVTQDMEDYVKGLSYGR